MVNLAYVNKRKRKKIISIVAAVGTLLMTTFIIVSYLGQRTGSFTVSLKTSNVQVALSTKSSFEEKTSYIRLDELHSLKPYCIQDVMDNEGQYSFDLVDNEETSPEMGGVKNQKTGEISYLNFFKYTFYLKNVGSNTARYDMNLRIINNSADSKTGKKIDEILRVGLFEDHEVTFYAKRSTDPDHYSKEEPENLVSKEYVCSAPDSDYYLGLAEEFKDQVNVFNISRSNFKANEMKQYTVLFWLEGHDAECVGEPPEECKLKLGVEIQAYEN